MNEYKSSSTLDTSTNILKSFRLPRFVRIAEASGDARFLATLGKKLATILKIKGVVFVRITCRFDSYRLHDMNSDVYFSIITPLVREYRRFLKTTKL